MRHHVFIAGALLAASTAAAQKRAITFDDFAAVRAVTDPQPSPDGKFILYAVRVADVAANKRTTQTFVVPSAGGTPRAFPSQSVSASEARWSPDGTHIAYIASDQLWIADANGANAKQLTHLNGGATGPVWSPPAIASPSHRPCIRTARPTRATSRRPKPQSDNKVKAHVADELMFRHWNAWDEGTRSHLFVVALDGSAPRDLMPGAKYDVPPGPFGGSEGYAWSPDGRELAYTAKDQGRDDAWSTDVNVYTVPAAGGAPTVITAANKGADQNPVYSPDGKFIALRVAGARRLRVRSLASHDLRPLREDVARAAARRGIATPTRYIWAPDMSALYVQTTDAGARQALPRRTRQTRERAQGERPTAAHRRSQQHGVLAVAATATRSPGCATPPKRPPKCTPPTRIGARRRDGARRHARERRARRAARA